MKFSIRILNKKDRFISNRCSENHTIFTDVNESVIVISIFLDGFR